MVTLGLLILTLLHPTTALLEVYAPSSHRALNGSKVLLQCTFSVGSHPVDPKFLAILWLFHGKQILSYDNKGLFLHPRVSFNEQAARTGDASISVSNVSIGDGGIYTCLVFYSPEKKEKQVTLDVLVPPVIQISKESAKTLVCSATGFSPPDIGINWLREGELLRDSHLGDVQRNDDGTYRANSTVTIMPNPDRKNQTFTCKVQHYTLREPYQEDFLYIYGGSPLFEWPRKMKMMLHESVGYILPNLELPRLPAPPIISGLEILKTDDGKKEALCSVTGFYPQEIRVNLLINKASVDTVLTQQRTRQNNDRTFDINVTKTLQPDDKPKSLSCEVSHEFLRVPLKKELSFEYEGLAVLNDIQGAQKCIIGEKTTLYCSASFCPPAAKLIWFVEREGCTRFDISEMASCDEEDMQPLISREYQVTSERKPRSRDKGYGDINSTLTFIPSVSRHKDAAVGCELTCGEKTQTKIFPLKALYAKPKVSPPEFTICDTHDIQVLLNLCDFYPNKIDVQWIVDKEQVGNTKEPSAETRDGTFNVGTKLKISEDRFTDPAFKVRVIWIHESMDEEGSTEFSVEDLPWHPQIEDISMQMFADSSKVKLHCKIYNFFPRALTVRWFEKLAGGPETDVTKAEKYTITEVSERENNHTFICNTSLVFNKSLVAEKEAEFICRVEHPSLRRPIQSSTGLLQLSGKHSSFIVNNIQGPQIWNAGEKLTLYCAASYCKEDIVVMWIMVEADGAKHEIKELLPEKDSKPGSVQPSGYVAIRERTEQSDIEGLQDITTSLTFTPSIARHNNVSAVCKLACGGKTREKTFQPRKLYAKPKASDHIKLALLDTGEVGCSFCIRGFYPRDLQVNWSAGALPSYNKMDSMDSVSDNELTGDVSTECKIPAELLKNPSHVVKVSWKHESMADWESRQISVRDKEYPWRPKVQDISLPELISNRPVSLVCKITKIFPDNVRVKWLKKEQNAEERFPLTHGEKYKISEIILAKENDKTFTCKACLKFIPSVEAEQGAEFICVVEHPSLERPIENKTGALQVKDHLRFIVSSIQGNTNWTQGEKAILFCMATYWPEAVKVSWTIKENDGRLYEVSDSPKQQSKTPHYVASRESMAKTDKEGLFDVTSSLKLTPSVQKHAGVEIKCKLVCDGKTKEREFQPNSIHAKPALLEPIKVTLGDSGEVMYSLNLHSFYPKDLSIGWTEGVGRSQGLTKSEEEFHENTDRTYSVRSELKVPGNKLKTPGFTVCVTWKHESMEQPESREMCALDPEFTWRPEIQEIPVSCILLNKRVTFQYNISGYFPDPVTVTWFKTEKGSRDLVPIIGNPSYAISDLNSRRRPDHTYSCTACLVFIPSLSSDQGAEFICRVEHPSLKQPIEKRTEPLQVKAKPALLEPIKVTLGDSGEVVYSLNLHSFYPKDLSIGWTEGVGRSQGLTKSEEEFHENTDRTYSVRSELKVPGNKLKTPGFTVGVTWKHESMEQPESREMCALDPEFTWRPEIQEIQEIPVSCIQFNKTVTFQYNISGYFPDPVTVTWFKKENGSRDLVPIIRNTSYKIPDLLSRLQPDHTYSCTARLVFIPSLSSDQGAEFICRVEHPSLKQPIEKRTEPLQIKAQQNENIKKSTIRISHCRKTTKRLGCILLLNPHVAVFGIASERKESCERSYKGTRVQLRSVNPPLEVNSHVPGPKMTISGMKCNMRQQSPPS
ncbi:uncharacterized protein RCH25_038042 [Pelodytes ibericus]